MTIMEWTKAHTQDSEWLMPLHRKEPLALLDNLTRLAEVYRRGGFLGFTIYKEEFGEWKPILNEEFVAKLTDDELYRYKIKGQTTPALRRLMDRASSFIDVHRKELCYR